MNAHIPTQPNDAQPVNRFTMNARMDARTQRVKTDFGSIYVTVGFDADGRAQHVHVATPGKHHETTVERTLSAIGDVVTQIIQDMQNEETGNGQTESQ